MSSLERSVQGPATGRMSAWRAPGVDAPWYPIAAMRWAGLPVIVTVNDRRNPDGGVRPNSGGYEVLAVMRRHSRQKRWWWFQLGWLVAPERWHRHEGVALEMVGRDPPSRYSPSAWRPIDPAAWPHPLPAPLGPAFGSRLPRAAPVEPAEGVDPHLASDGWPYPDIALGEGVPASREECEARVLRAFRTSASRAGGGGVGHVRRGMCADIPKEIVLASVHLNEVWWSAHPDADGSIYEAVRSGWTPTERDKNDWLTALGWLSGLDRKSLRAVALRAADPPWSFTQIAERIGVRRNVTARGVYERAIDHAFWRARRMLAPLRGVSKINGG